MKDRSEGVESSMARNVSKSIPGERQVLLPALVCVCVCVCVWWGRYTGKLFQSQYGYTLVVDKL